MSFVQTLTSREIDSRLARIREERLDPHGFSERLAQAAMAGIGLDILEQGQSAAIAVPEPQPANPWEAKGRAEKLARFMARLDRFAGHQVTAAEVAASPAMIAAMLAGESRQPSETTIKALADALLAREGNHG